MTGETLAKEHPGHHAHKCPDCGCVWCHPDDSPYEDHTCPQCGDFPTGWVFSAPWWHGDIPEQVIQPYLTHCAAQPPLEERP